MARQREELTYVRMRRNVRKKVSLPFKHYELRVKAMVECEGQTPFESIMPLIKIKYLKRLFVKDEIQYDLQKIKGIQNADLEIEVFAVYGTETYIGEYKRYLGELNFYMSSISNNEKTIYRYKDSLAYFQQPEKSDFIPERI